MLQNSEIAFDQTVYVEFSVNYFEKINQIKDKLKHFHLTIPECWLSKSVDGNDLIQPLIKNG